MDLLASGWPLLASHASITSIASIQQLVCFQSPSSQCRSNFPRHVASMK